MDTLRIFLDRLSDSAFQGVATLPGSNDLWLAAISVIGALLGALIGIYASPWSIRRRLNDERKELYDVVQLKAERNLIRVTNNSKIYMLKNASVTVRFLDMKSRVIQDPKLVRKVKNENHEEIVVHDVIRTHVNDKGDGGSVDGSVCWTYARPSTEGFINDHSLNIRPDETASVSLFEPRTVLLDNGERRTCLEIPSETGYAGAFPNSVLPSRAMLDPGHCDAGAEKCLGVVEVKLFAENLYPAKNHRYQIHWDGSKFELHELGL